MSSITKKHELQIQFAHKVVFRFIFSKVVENMLEKICSNFLSLFHIYFFTIKVIILYDP
jgi:hypothetical protein